MASSGMFCAHKRLTTTCPECRPPPPPPPEKPARRASSHAPAREEAAAPARATGPGKPLLPKRKQRAKGATREEAERAQAWWVRDK